MLTYDLLREETDQDKLAKAKEALARLKANKSAPAPIAPKPSSSMSAEKIADILYDELDTGFTENEELIQETIESLKTYQEYQEVARAYRKKSGKNLVARLIELGDEEYGLDHIKFLKTRDMILKATDDRQAITLTVDKLPEEYLEKILSPMEITNLKALYDQMKVGKQTAPQDDSGKPLPGSGAIDSIINTIQGWL